MTVEILKTTIEKNITTRKENRFFQRSSINLHHKIQKYVEVLKKYADRTWYPPLVGVLAALDNFFVVIPNDGILISSSMLTPRRWFALAAAAAIGSTVGAVALASFVETQGLQWILQFYPGINETKYWLITEEFFGKYGLVLVFGVAITPILQQPAIILASLAQTPLLPLAAVLFAGRFIKYLLMAYLGSHAPKMLNKIWGIKGELKDAGVEIK